MALSPVERLNVFDSDLRKELRSRSLSKNLVQVRAPFLRFTTATDMSGIEQNSALFVSDGFLNYTNCKFFTLGLHGWDNKNYSAADLYGTQATKGLIVGTTYRQSTGEQILVHSHGGIGSPITPFGTIISSQSPENYPPPGITSAKVERVRSGNVVKIQLEIQCHTQEQLEVLDAMCFIPGVTCILEWGSILTTPNGSQELVTLDFRKPDVIQDIQDAKQQSRSSFIERWVKPNKFNYDFAVVNIANVKTTIQNNVYNISVTAYGKGDNILYISAYATSNPLSGQVDTEQTVVKSISEYFRMAGPFSIFLKDNVDNVAGNIIRFYDPVNRAEASDIVPTATDSGTTNDLGLEDSYFINFTYFIDEIINRQVKSIVVSATGNEFLDRLLTPLTTSGDEVILTGYNRYLRSTNPETMIIYNDQAIQEAKKRVSNAAQIGTLVSKIPGLQEARTTPTQANEQQNAVTSMAGKPFGAGISTESGLTNLGIGVWLNSKAIQSAFLNARTFMEGLEALLRNINAATENYWDLKLFYDDEKQEFRILDDNARDVQVNSTNDKIYEFNKRINAVDKDTLGPDVLDIQVATDYPKMLFSQLAVSGINGGNLANIAQRRDADFANKSLKDIFAENKSTSTTGGGRRTQDPPPAYPAGTMGLTELSRNLSNNLFGDTTRQGDISSALTSFSIGGATGVPSVVANFINTVFSNKRLLSENDARRYRDTLTDFVKKAIITEQQAASITALFAMRAKAIITRDKNNEKQQFEASFTQWYDRNNINLPGLDIYARSKIKGIVNDKIDASLQSLKAAIDGRVSNQLNVVSETQRQAEQSQATRPGQIGGGAVAGSAGRGGP